MLGLGLGLNLHHGRVPDQIKQLFAATGAQGAYYDPSDLSTLFQDTAGTTLVTAVGQSVALIKDKSGNGNHASQATAANQPTLQKDASGFYYLSFDGTNDQFDAFPAPIAAPMWQETGGYIVAACEFDSLGGTVQGLMGNTGSSQSTSNAPGFGAMWMNVSPTFNQHPNIYITDGTTYLGNGSGSTTDQQLPAGTTAVQIWGANPATSTNPGVFTQTNSSASPVSAYTGAAAPASTTLSPIKLGCGNSTGGFPMKGRIYGVSVVFGTALSAAQLASIQRTLGARAGLSL